MKDVKYRLLDASVYDYPLIEKWLTDQAAEGWHLEKVGSAFWKFRRGEPKRVRYEATYAPKASAFNSRPTEAEEDLAQLCANAGWVRVATLAQLHIFRNEDPDATPLETDEDQRLFNIRRTVLRHTVPQLLVMMGLFLLQFCMHGSTALRYPARTLSSPLMVGTLMLTASTTLYYLLMLLGHLLWLRRARLAVDAGREIPAFTFHRWFKWVMWGLLLGYLCFLLWTCSLAYVAYMLAISAVTLTCTVGCIRLCKECNAPKWANFVVPTIVTFIVISVLLTLFAVSFDNFGWDEPQSSEVPLTLAELGISGDGEPLVLEASASPLAGYQRCWDQGNESISYTIVDVKCGLFYDMILNEQEQNYLQSADYLTTPNESITVQNELWDADYVRHSPGSINDRWFICWGDRIVSLRASWTLTEEQIGQIAACLKP